MPPLDANLVLLTIDDDHYLRSSLVAYFEDCGFTVFQACDGQEGIKLATALRPDVIITDLRMPKVDGLGVVDAIRHMDDNLPILVLSGTGVLTDAIEALRRGAWDYLAKPVQNMMELELMVARCLERAQLVSENRNYQENLEQLVGQRTAELRKLTTAVEQSANTVVITGVDGTIEYVNPKFSQTSGYSREEALGNNLRFLKSGKQPESLYRNLWETISSGQEWSGELCNMARDGREYWELCSIAPIKDESGAITNFVAIKEDITTRKRSEEQLYYQANYDALTGLPNRYYMQTYLSYQLEVMDTNSQLLSLMVLDIDNLKFINDTFGHEFGDKLLSEISGRLKDACPKECMVSRFLGNEFVIILPLSQPAESTRWAEIFRRAIATVFVIGGTEIITTASIGVVVYPKDGECVESLIKNAESAMFQAKLNGKNNVVSYTREFNNQLEQRLTMETKLHKALDCGEFSLHYQPQIDQALGAIIGVEALLRWTPAGESPVPPGQFVPILEESGLIVAVGEWVLWQACRQAVQWQQEGLPALRLSVNISSLQFMRSDLDILVRRVLDATGLDPRRLCLELTESMIMIDSTRSMDTLTALTKTGALLSLDDFGTGYSSLAYLGRLPIHELKIDQSFVRRMLTTKNDAAVVNTIIAMAHGLEMELVAEGVETLEELNYLAEKQCGIIQGYYYSRPLPPDECARFIRNWQSTH